MIILEHMHIDTWLERNNYEKSEFAERLGISTNCFLNYRKGLRDIPLSLAMKIEKITKEEVTVYDLAKLLKKNNS